MTQTTQRRPASVQDLKDLLGVELGPTEWHVVDQAKIDAFADLTGDHQWIHVDPERAADSAFGSTIAQRLRPGTAGGSGGMTVSVRPL